ncbi:hypothetical protein J6590_072050 [Homalodisca vitripennis]|nr:hypothetical protein J6590_072050 [Homalodisca vitripennis]
MPVQWVRRTGSARDKADNYNTVLVALEARNIQRLEAGKRWELNKSCQMSISV